MATPAYEPVLSAKAWEFFGSLSNRRRNQLARPAPASWFGVNFEGQVIKPSLSVRWQTNEMGFDRLIESLSPHRVLGVDEEDELIDPLVVRDGDDDRTAKQSFPQMILESLKVAGVQQAHKEDRITFTALVPWPGNHICAEGRYLESSPASPTGPTGQTRSTTPTQRRAGILIGPEFGTLQRIDLVDAAWECGDAGFDVLIACAFNYDAHSWRAILISITTTSFSPLRKPPGWIIDSEKWGWNPGKKKSDPTVSVPWNGPN